MTYKEVEENGLAYKYIRGSMLYGTNVEGSDTDYGGVFIIPEDRLYGLRCKYIEQVSDAKSDITYYELGRWVELLSQGNPNVLEGLFAPEDKIVGDIHPAAKLIRENRDLFLSKRCFASLGGYAIAQIKKARGLNKKIVNPMVERKDVLDFCYTFKGQGSQPVKDFLKEHGLKQEYCGLVSVQNMREAYAVFYDFGKHIQDEGITEDSFCKAYIPKNYYNLTNEERFVKFIMTNGQEWLSPLTCFQYKPKAFGYRGITSSSGESNEVRLSSIPKGEKPIFHMTFNIDAYTKHCKDYREYKDWEKKRNPLRYKSNLNKNYDSKNVSHCVRLLHMGIELGEGKGLNVVRTDDRQFLIDIRNHKYEYDEIIDYIEGKKELMNELEKESTLPDNVDMDKIDKLLREARRIAYKK